MGYHGGSSSNMYNGNNVHAMNGVPADYDMAMQHPQQHPPPPPPPPQQQQQHHQQDGYSIQAELDMFTNTQFFDFDMGEMPENSPTFEGPGMHNAVNGSAPQSSRPSVDFMNGDLQFPNFNHYATMGAHDPNALPPSLQPHNSYAQRPNVSSGSSPSSSANTPHLSQKGKADPTLPSDPQSLEEASRMAAEEDKRRRNTAASARFRIKKKQREQALEKTAKEMTERVNYLESRVGQLEMENKLLKDLITEKSGKEVDIAELRRKFAAASASGNASGNTSSSSDEAGEVKPEREGVKIDVENM